MFQHVELNTHFGKTVHVDTFGSFHAQRFFLPSPPHLRTFARYSPPPSPFLWVSAHHSVITSFAGRQFLPTIHEIHKIFGYIWHSFECWDPSVEMRSPDSDLQTAFKHCAERPTTTEETGEKKCAALRSAQKQALLCLRLNGWLLCSTKNLCAVTILNEITLLFETCHVSTCGMGHIPRNTIT